MMEKLYVMAEISVDPNHVEEVQKTLLALAAASLNEDGCLNYQILHSNENVFSTLELWTSENAENLHWQTEHVKTALQKIEPFLLEAATVRKFFNL
jgi:quinol monooxygenase YgiN